ncbi:hypothetical protein N7495_007597 [Penicillium taxi]|uniref:uncharacterized protein n=1 Tax=Penicillium taxi TaxID=168475 RepID=UPI0025457C8B|nr:uncharacterized protein N7495_007597 [Penicillium taxi]KAJ5887556.1 hypothetical protein N7495_007597 [Penicillium taxi]
MSSIIVSIKDLVASIFEVIFSLFHSAFAVVRGVFTTAIDFLTSVLNLVLDTIKGTLEAAGGVGKFVIGNIFTIAIIGIGAVGYLQYQRSQGRSVKVGDKKLN